MGADDRSAASSEAGRVFNCNYSTAPEFEPIALRLTVKQKALGKSFLKVVVDPYLKALNAKLAPADHVTLDRIEKVMVGPGDRVSDIVEDLSMAVSAVIPGDVEDGKDVRMDILTRKPRTLQLVLMDNDGKRVHMDADLPAKYVHLPLNQAVLPEFIRRLNESYEGKLVLSDISEVVLLEQVVDVTLPCFRTLPRAGKTELQVTLTEVALSAIAEKLPPRPKPSDANAPVGQVFRVRCSEVELKLTLPAKGLGKSLREGVVSPFLRAYATKIGRKGVDLTPELTRVEVDGMAVSDMVLASSFATGAPAVRVELTLGERRGTAGGEAASPVGESASACTESALPSPPPPAPLVSQTGGNAMPASPDGVGNSLPNASYYAKWAAFDDVED